MHNQQSSLGITSHILTGTYAWFSMFMISSPAYGVTGGEISSYTGATAGVVVDNFLFSGDCKYHLVNRIPMRKPMMNIKTENISRDTVREGTSIPELLFLEADVLIARKRK